MSSTDPTTIRLSDSFLLSDFMGCTSVYEHGYKNRIDIGTQDGKDRLREGKYLAFMLEQLQEEFGALYIAYGYVSPSLSRQIVKYQDPNKPSYHRWDAGAAADVMFPFWAKKPSRERNDDAPIFLAHDIDDLFDYSRMITYSESNWICFATKYQEFAQGKFRRAFYENRYVGTRRPKHIKYPMNTVRREAMKKEVTLEHDWRGQGYPSYHGGGKRQYEHMPANPGEYSQDVTYTPWIKFLYNKVKVADGKRNVLPIGDSFKRKKVLEAGMLAGGVLEAVMFGAGHHISVIRGYNSGKPAHDWSHNYDFVIDTGEGTDQQEMADFIDKFSQVAEVRVIGKHLRIIGEEIY